MSKKVIFSIISILCLLIAIASIYYFLPLNSNKETSQKCDPYSNIGSVSKTEDVKVCDCLEDEVQKKKCQSNISDAASFAIALKQDDLSLCEVISKQTMRDSCLKIVKGKIDFTEKNKSASLTASSSEQR